MRKLRRFPKVGEPSKPAYLLPVLNPAVSRSLVPWVQPFFRQQIKLPSAAQTPVLPRKLKLWLDSLLTHSSIDH